MQAVGRPRFQTLLIGIFALVALLLAAVGIYGVISYSAAQRTHEIGLRIALGANRRNILQLILKHGLVLVLSGVAIGVAGAFALTRFLTTSTG